ncbi:hypothetical protein Acid345_2475 [Candidatus Koribacter versatilis Ellin345]|uniref:Peptidylprolyl isomerase n=1 Tax=Koribacter versatilis (strain Ellin345) TaxID=204669 RepID=Q1INS4_KORVE|nr:SurA N-terminal domain-containing protein [Candidatus Koribacter versatilis]ABF41476.1 hypothetical protein Acid345_2475 [Candidatus Koribacter versatilis Ellin345]
MNRLVHKLGLALVLALAVPSSRAGEVIDRLVASVDSTPILQSDWDEAVAFEALQQGRLISSFTENDRREVLQHLVDQRLIQAQIGDSQIAAAEEREITKSLDDLRKLYPQATTDEAWRSLLQTYGLDQETVRRKTTAQLEALRFINLRLRPESRIARADVESYYKNNYVPEVQKRGEKPEELTVVSPKIEEILRQQRMATLLTNWLQELHNHADIRWIVPSAAPAAQAANREVQ